MDGLTMERGDDAKDRSGTLAAVVVLPNQAGLHARSAAALIREAMRFESSVTLHGSGGTANGRSLMELLRLGARQGDAIRIQVRGDDAEAALRAVKALLENGFGEE